VLGLWRDFVLRLSSAPVVSIARIRGRKRGIRIEFVVACDMRFASRQSAQFSQPEIGVGLDPGGGAPEWLPRLVGRSRAFEIVLSGDDFDAYNAERYGWVNRTMDDGDPDSFIDTLVQRLASFDRETLGIVKARGQSVRDADSRRTSIEQRHDLLTPGRASARARPCQGPRYRLRCSERLRIKLRPLPPCIRAGGRR
jgi:enoyl-CoA hydratase/carnithine racemase